MYINEVTNEPIAVHSENEHKHVDFAGTQFIPETELDVSYLEKIKSTYKGLKFLLLDPIREDGLLINFDGEATTSISIVDQSASIPIVWNPVKIINIRFPDKGSVHLVASNRPGHRNNRRSGYRISISSTATIEVNQLETKTGQMKDISSTGVAFISKEEICKIGDMVMVSFTDDSKNFKVTAKVVRVEEKDRWHVYGCAFLAASDSLARYINEKQRKKSKLR